MLIRAAVIWLVLLCGAVLNGGFREAVPIAAYGIDIGHVVSTVLLCAVILAVTYLSIDWMQPTSAARARKVGLLWLTLTLGVEFLVGHYVFGHSWEQLLADYSLQDGRIWVLVLAATAMAPWWALRNTQREKRLSLP